MSRFDDDDDDLEIIDTTNLVATQLTRPGEDKTRITSDNIDVNDISDYRFILRNNNIRLKELFPHIKSIYDLDIHELRTAKCIIDREKTQTKSDNHENTLIGQKRKFPDENSVNESVKSINSDNSVSLQYKITQQSTVKSQTNSILATLYSNDKRPQTISTQNNSSINKPLGSNSISSSSSSIRESGHTKIDSSKQPSISGSRLGPTIKTMPIQSQSSARWQGEETYRMVGDSIIDVKKLEANARKYTLGASSFNSGPGLKRSEQGSTTKATNLKVHAQEANLMAEIDSLLSKKSAHSTEADEEWFANYSNRLDKLAKEEYKANMKANLAFIKIQAFECLNCDKEHSITEAYPNLCKAANHGVRQITVVKKFFQCGRCGRRDSTLIADKDFSERKLLQYMPPNRRCSTCGNDAWISIGKQSATGATIGSGTGAAAIGPNGGVSSLTGDKLIVSATDWTSHKDKLAMATKVSNLYN